MPQFAALPSTSFPCTSVVYARSTVAQAIVERLHAARIRHIIYVPGGPMMPFISTAFQSGYFRFILCRHEQGAGFMAEGLARATRRPALVAVTAGPGVTNIVTPVYVAQREMTPVFVLSADVARHADGKGAAQELDTVGLLKPITKRSEAIHDANLASHIVDELLNETVSGVPGPVHLSIAACQWSEVTC